MLDLFALSKDALNTKSISLSFKNLAVEQSFLAIDKTSSSPSITQGPAITIIFLP
jgi:hypothetical protein